MSTFLLQCLFITSATRFWGYYKKKVEYVNIGTEVLGLFGEFTIAFIILSVIDLLLWLIS